jgi:hypothetical protein
MKCILTTIRGLRDWRKDSESCLKGQSTARKIRVSLRLKRVASGWQVLTRLRMKRSLCVRRSRVY